MVLIHEYVTGGGLAGQELPPSLAAEGSAMRRAVAEDFAQIEGINVVMTLDWRLPDEPGPWEVVRIGPGEEILTFFELTRSADWTLCVAPETSGVLLHRADALLGGWIGGPSRSLGSQSAAIGITGDKLKLGYHLAALGIVTPPSRRVVPALDLPADLPWPVVLKPVDGAGSELTFVVGAPDAVPAAARELAQALVQPWVPGTPMSASFLVDADGVPHLVGVGRQRIDLVEGAIRYRGGVVPAGESAMAAEARRAVAAVEGLRGWVGVDFLWEPAGRAVILEINPRLTTSYVGLRRLLPPGELARAWLAALEEPSKLESFALAERVHAASPVRFDADGTIRPGDDDGDDPP
jgi:predicted ATP-grasp superfamily ATP-dependent carboligase